ncbi:hypothetical protein CoHVHLJ_080 [Columbid alphaherpesvirus 1]|uniref:Uncharacterized protein n=1 Tax=Columbid alphaherpesvirus 1 TaxID=93386 RepID=A0A1V0M8L8_9ALPH|nr:hypothetical protein CoHVHLJ_080 [Columbid alphaherpesvirus 1]ARD71391.1 hypothetical protein CoHVHLJ_080 [Columbid alphaherpesvirus 1]
MIYWPTTPRRGFEPRSPVRQTGILTTILTRILVHAECIFLPIRRQTGIRSQKTRWDRNICARSLAGSRGGPLLWQSSRFGNRACSGKAPGPIRLAALWRRSRLGSLSGLAGSRRWQSSQTVSAKKGLASVPDRTGFGFWQASRERGSLCPSVL